MIDELVFDTRYGEGRFYFESESFPQGEIMSALSWASRLGVAGAVRSVCCVDGSAVLRSRRSWATRDEAERAMATFLMVVDRGELWRAWWSM